MLCFLLNSCSKCGGDLILDEGDWKCMQCGQYYYKEPVGIKHGEPVSIKYKEPVADDSEEDTSEGRKEAYKPRSTRNVNSLIQAKNLGDERWWERNRQIIEYLDQGLSVHEVSTLTSRGQRQIRTVRERLLDMRASSL